MSQWYETHSQLDKIAFLSPKQLTTTILEFFVEYYLKMEILSHLIWTDSETACLDVTRKIIALLLL